MNAAEIRSSFLAYFESKGHKVKLSASLIPKDPTVLLTIAGMIPFKPYFLGLKPAPFSRATSSQKCIRTNDLENVGKTPRHHTFFEMLGNFSFGDYFKKEAIQYAWDYLTNVLKLDKSKLYISIFVDDDEAYELWLSETDLSKNRIIRLGEEHNFWESGPTGPCGPCSEIYYDTGIDPNCEEEHCAPGCDCDRFLEIWNLVFMQYDKDDQGVLTPLPKKNIDTGMGLERIATVLQNVPSNFDTDLFAPILAEIRLLAKTEHIESIHLIADHIRAITFMVTDGVYPGNDGRGYVLKKIMRRAIRHGKILGIDQSFLPRLADVVISHYASAYPELKQKSTIIMDVLKAEENNFSQTLDFGLALLDELIQENQIISGDDAFKLYDTFGFPLELTEEIARERNVKVDLPGFEKRMDEQRERSRDSAIFYKDGEKPSGGEAIIATTESDVIEMARNHSATHLLQAALRKILGTHVHQSGSMVSPERLRFDFSHPKALTEEELNAVENEVNQAIMTNHLVDICHQTYDQAIDQGAIALFTEKYSEEVRVVSMGDFSMELCGGTHVNRTGDIGLFVIVNESAISTGIRRIEAVTGTHALAHIQKRLNILKQVTRQFKINEEAILPTMKDLKDDHAKIQKIAAEHSLTLLVDQILKKAEKTSTTVGDTSIFLNQHELPQGVRIDTKKLMDQIHQKLGGIVGLLLIQTNNQKITVVVKVASALTKKVQAGQIVKTMCQILGGNGGGRPDFAQGGGSDKTAIPRALDTALNDLSTLLKS